MAREPTPSLIQFDEVAFRYSNYDTPFWVRPNSDPGRWHWVGDGATQYLSTTVAGAWAERLRSEGLRAGKDVALVRMPMWVAEVHVQRIADYGTFEKAEMAGFPSDALIDDDHSRCQEEGRRLREGGFQGVLAPSSALPGTLNLNIFGARISSTRQLRSLLASSIPASEIAVGSPPEGVVDRVRQRGEKHELYEEFCASARAHRQAGGAN